MLETVSVLLGAGSFIYLIALTIVLCIGIIKLMRGWRGHDAGGTIKDGQSAED